ncbi:unnamed protein product [Vitrella brassicaformis CCMP3155]|uniref:Small nuclear ribonucleoprotein Sm D3 n=1 Tax=Vitrella brassicaformis (strain CCMP3155) TaxID=1169540 RepID=A0A0G4EGZ8_VITBC|nr:unnamed protein product [Vitrella brassicaformis CCMP3155]|eukprot:CEL95517.1 unnamed protein product [Vitrella brassicaformis CCMP3155]
MAQVGIPIKVLYEGLGHTVTVETKSGELFRGILQNAEDNMNIMLESITVTAKDGKTSQLEQLYIRGSQIRFLILPDMLRHAPMFKFVGPKGRGRALGLGAQRRAQAMRQRGAAAAGFRGGRGGRGRG